MSAIVTKITTKRFNFEMTDTVTNAKQRAITAQNARLKKRIAELTGKETSPKPQIKEPAALVYKRRDDGYRTYHTFEGDPVAAASAVKATGAILFAVGFAGVSEETLNTMASSPSSRFSVRGADLEELQTYFATDDRFCQLVVESVPSVTRGWS